MYSKFKEWRAEVEKERCLRGLSLKEIAKATNYNYSYLQQVLKGRMVGQPCVDRVSELLGIEPYTYPSPGYMVRWEE